MDTVDKATRSRIMRAIKSRNTGPERRLAAALRRAKVKELCWWSQSRAYKLPGSPDFVFATAHLAVFVHGCFWHLCPKHYKAPAGEGFRAKMDRNRRRDIRVRRQLRKMGWRTMVVWEHTDADRAAARIRRHLQVEAVRERLSPPLILGVRRTGPVTFTVNFGEQPDGQQQQ
jgi:DNA mismatch endonuclease (patch repair protein)